MIVFAEQTAQMAPSSSLRDLNASTEAGRLVGAQVYVIPPDFSLCETADNALYHVPLQEQSTAAVWIGYIPSWERYNDIYQAAARKNVFLLNSPEQHQAVQEFDRAYPFLEGLTPRSLTVDSLEAALEAASQIGFPLFVKGAVQSRKSRGWKACVAQNRDELQVLCAHLFDLGQRSRGRVVLRELVSLRHARKADDFPMGREFRLFLLKGEVLGCGYYWEGDDPLASLTEAERLTIEDLARRAAQRLPAPYVAIDIGQLESGAWTVIETGDPQFSGFSQIPVLAFWSKLKLTLDAGRV